MTNDKADATVPGVSLPPATPPALVAKILISPTGAVYIESALPPRETAGVLISALAQAVVQTENPPASNPVTIA